MLITTVIVLGTFLLAGSVLAWRVRHDKRMIARHIGENGGAVEKVQFRLTPFPGAYEVHYRDSHHKRRRGRCVADLWRVYWSSDESRP